MDRLKSETRPHHDRAEGAGFGSAMMSMTLPLNAYKVHIAAHREVHRVIEDAHIRSSSDRIEKVWHEGLRKVPLLDSDLLALDFEVTEMPVEVQAAVLQQRRTVSVSRCLPPHPHLAQVCLLNLQLNRWRHFKCVGNVKSAG